jgi:cation transport ATPase
LLMAPQHPVSGRPGTSRRPSWRYPVLLKFVETVRVARRCRRIIRFNFAGTLAADGVGMGLAAAGMLNPLSAAFIHVSSELAFILNSARLLPGVSRRG